jgi:hypothetical protein
MAPTARYPPEHALFASRAESQLLRLIFCLWASVELWPTFEWLILVKGLRWWRERRALEEARAQIRERAKRIARRRQQRDGSNGDGGNSRNQSQTQQGETDLEAENENARWRRVRANRRSATNRRVRRPIVHDSEDEDEGRTQAEGRSDEERATGAMPAERESTVQDGRSWR